MGSVRRARRGWARHALGKLELDPHFVRRWVVSRIFRPVDRATVHHDHFEGIVPLAGLESVGLEHHDLKFTAWSNRS